MMTDSAVRETLRPHRDGGPISRLYATGEITGETIPALGVKSGELDDAGDNEAAERLSDVIRYVDEAGERPPVRGWVAKV
ncbi:hypothetical protein ACJ6WD_09630 [Streptomyces sp. VTCC 41912]|uniref:hypothetical protein n=1 Tax=Streptomyces TaxID=1883 RepID=UPI002F25ECFB